MAEDVERIDTERFWVQKKDVFIKLKLWDDEKTMKMIRVKKVLEIIAAFVFAKLSRGREISVAVARYMKEHAAADNVYSIQLKNQLVYLPSPTSQYSDPLKLSLSLLGQVQQSLSVSFRELSQNIETIINTQIATNLMDFEKNVSEALSLWSTAQTDTSLLLQKSEKLFKDYLSVFASQEAEISKKGFVTSCLWLIETKYLNSVQDAHKSLISCAILVKSFWEMLIKVEGLRVETLKKAISSFIQLHDSVFHIKAEEAWKLIQDLESDSWELAAIVGEDESQNFWKEFGEGDFFERIIDWKLPEPPKSQLIVREGDIDRETAVFKVWKKSYGVLTVDRFLHVFNEDSLRNFEQTVNSCFLHRGNVIENEELYFEIIEAKQLGLLSKLAAPRRSVFKLHVLDEFLEWIKAIKQLV